MQTVQKLASRAFGAVTRWLLGKRGRMQPKGPRQLERVESTSTQVGIRWYGEHVEWFGLVLPTVLLHVSVRTLADRLERPTATPQPLIPHFVWPKTITMIYGPTGVGKTTLLVNLALSAIGDSHPTDVRRVFPPPTRPLKMLYIGAEDSLEMFEHVRLTPELLEYYKVGDHALSRFHYCLRRLTLASSWRKDVQLEGLIAFMNQQEEPFDLLILDPISRFHLGLDENSNAQMARVMAALDQIRERTGAAVLFSYHTGTVSANRGVRRDPTAARGAAVLSDQSHTVWSLSRGRGGTLVLTPEKMNYAPLPRPIVFERGDGGVLRLVEDPEVSRAVAIVMKLAGRGEGVVRRSEVIKELATRLKVSPHHARRVVGRAEELGRILRVGSDGKPDDGGRFVTLPS